MLWRGTDRTQKTIGVVNTAPLYQPLSGFDRYEDSRRDICYWGGNTDSNGYRPEGVLRVCAYSPDGRWFAYATTEEYVGFRMVF